MRRFSWLLALLLFVSCDSGTDPEQDNDPGPGSTEVQGFFLDDAVEGLEYTTGGSVRLTDEFGLFHFEPGASVLFSVDGVELGTVAQGLQRITPNDFGVSGSNIARFVQSLDTSPEEPGIDLTGLDLAPTPIDFVQSAGAFGADPAVLAAVAAAELLGGSGRLVSQGEAGARLAAGTNGIFDVNDIENLMVYPVTAGVDSEPCVVLFRADGSGINICEDDVEDDPSSAAAGFDWLIDDWKVSIDFGVDEQVTVQRLGDTGNRISVSVLSECLSCDPNVEPVFTTELQNLVVPLPLFAADFDRQIFDVFSSGPITELQFDRDGVGTLSQGVAIFDMLWSIDPDFANVLLVRSVGPANSEVRLIRAFQMSGEPRDGEYALLIGEGTDLSGDGIAQEAEIFSYSYVGSAQMSARTWVRGDCFDESCGVESLPFAGSPDAPTITSVVLECQSSTLVALATATDPQGSANLIGIEQEFGVFTDDSCAGDLIVLYDDLSGSGVEESFSDVVDSDDPLYTSICDCLTWPVELSFRDADDNVTTGRFAATVVK